MKDRKLRSYTFIFICSAVAVFYLWIAAHVPYTGDDWDWGLDIGLQHLLTADINSRYAGNLAVVLMTRSKLLQILIMGGSYVALPFLMVAIVTNGEILKHPDISMILFLAANCLLLTMDKAIWQQTYGWISGFANYGISAVLLEVCILLVMPLFRESLLEKSEGIWGIIAYFLLGAAIQLFLENLAIFMMMFSAVVCGVNYLREKKIRRRYAALLAGNLIGLVIMFGNPMYLDLMKNGTALENGRKMVTSNADGLIAGALKNFSQEMATLIWENNVVICCSISLLLILLWICGNRREPRKWEWLLVIIDLLSIPYFVVFTHLEYGKYFLQRFGLLDVSEVLVNVGYFTIVALQVVLLFRGRFWHMWKLLLIWLGAPMVVLPLTVVLDEGGRFYLTSNIFLILFAVFLLDAWLKELPKKGTRFVKLVMVSVMVSCALLYFFIYRVIGICTHERMEIIAEAQNTGAKEIVLPAYPYSVRDYVWWGEPGEEYREIYFRDFFGLEQDVQMTFYLE